MSWLERSYDLELDNEDDAKYWRFVGEEWVWYQPSDAEIKWIEEMGKRRYKFGTTRTKVDHTKEDSPAFHISGIAGELAVHRFTGEKINQIELKSKTIADVGKDIEVKTARTQNGMNLMINKGQVHLSRRYVLVLTALYPKYTALMGWAYGRQFPVESITLPWRPNVPAHRIGFNGLSPMNTFEVNYALV